MKSELKTKQIDDWIIKYRQPSGEGPFKAVLMLHGWTGDENSMWVFGSQLPEDYFIVAPRAPFPSTSREYGGYSWYEHKTGVWSSMDDFQFSLDALDGLIGKLGEVFPADFSKFHIVGFSQGAALAYAYSLVNPDKVKSISAFAGFTPNQFGDRVSGQPFLGMDVFIGHGTKDVIIPIEKAIEAKEIMTAAGASVEFCQSDVGHKLGANCFTGFHKFMGERERAG